MMTVLEKTPEVAPGPARNSSAIDVKQAPKLYATPYSTNSVTNDGATIIQPCAESSCARVAWTSSVDDCRTDAFIAPLTGCGNKRRSSHSHRTRSNYYCPAPRGAVAAAATGSAQVPSLQSQELPAFD